MSTGSPTVREAAPGPQVQEAVRDAAPEWGSLAQALSDRESGREQGCGPDCAPSKRRDALHCAPQDPEPIPGFPRFGYVPLQGVINCRDLGGLPTEDGRRVKKRRLLRSADLHDATAEDMKQLVRMHDLEYVIDFRAEYELESDPDPLPLMHGIEYVDLPALSDGAIGFSGLRHLGSDVKTMMEFVRDPFELVQGLYSKCLLGAYGMRAYSRFLNDLLLAESGASLWHCTQGKDRTGIASLLVEHALGVPVEYMRRDYLATNLFIKPWVDKMSGVMRKNILLHGLGIDLEAYSYANLCYFDTALATVRDSYGSMDNYLERALDFGPDKRARLRELYLE